MPAPSSELVGKITHVFFLRPHPALIQKLRTLLCIRVGEDICYTTDRTSMKYLRQETIDKAVASGELVAVKPFDPKQPEGREAYVTSLGKIVLAKTKRPANDKKRIEVGQMPENEPSGMILS